MVTVVMFFFFGETKANDYRSANKDRKDMVIKDFSSLS